MASIDRLLEIMARLRDPRGGCPWDLEQSFATIAPYTIEEAYEVDDAVRRGDLDALREELGDLLLQVVFHAQMAREAGRFDFGDVVRSISEKLVRRHPHVFPEEAGAGAAPEAPRSAAEQTGAWEEFKAAERRERAGAAGDEDPFSEVALGLPALLRAQKLQRRAARAGLAAEAAPVDAAWAEFRAAAEADTGAEAVASAAGALLFAVAAAAGGAGVDAEQALRDANARFERAARARRP